MHFLLDTHILLWSLYSPARLPSGIKTILEDDYADVEFSIVSLWEIEIKNNKYKDEFSFCAEDTFRDAKASGFHMMKLEPEQISTLGRLNKPKKKHKDPFDRMLIAQAKENNSYLLTHDKWLTVYDEECVQYF